MKTLVCLALAGALACSGFAAELKIATVDLQRLLSEYHRAQEVGRQLREKQGSLQKELEGLRLEGRRLLAETDDLHKLTRDTALSSLERDNKRTILESKLADLRAFEVKYDNARAQREAALQAFAAQNNKRIMEDVAGATRAVADKNDIDLVLNANRANPFASDVLYSKNILDLTDTILASLNKSAPAAQP